MEKYEVDKSIVLDGFEVVGDHQNSKLNTIIEIRCKECNKIQNIDVKRYKLGRYRCNHGKRLIADNCIGDTFGIIKIDSIYGKDENNRTLVNCHCIICSNASTQYFHRITGFMYKCSCEKVNYEQEMIEKFSKLIGTEVKTDTVIDIRYASKNEFNNRTLLRLKCNKCGGIREVGANAFVNSNNYKKCNCMPKTRDMKEPLNKYNKTVLNKRFGSLVVNKLSGGYSLQTIDATCQCDCGNTFITKLSNIVSGDTRSCGCKIESYGERIITDILNEYNIHFEKQKSYNDLISVHNRKLKIDFVIYKNNKEIAFIEYDGPHHFLPFAYGHDIEEHELLKRFEDIKSNDKIKDEYAINNNIKMIRIPYKNDITHDYIEDILMYYNILSKKNEGDTKNEV